MTWLKVYHSLWISFRKAQKFLRYMWGDSILQFYLGYVWQSVHYDLIGVTKEWIKNNGIKWQCTQLTHYN